ncbi:MAG: nucleoside triphosphate pyrophosphatase [Pseudomonadota bacterium]|jgi:MAF protein|nr:MAG: septum formation protein Maf [Pseudomonadota bacterium]
MRAVILASTSPYRRELLGRLRIDFGVEKPGVAEEHLAGEAPAERARRLSLAKARAVAERHPRTVVIGSDQVAALDGDVLDKPGDEERCRDQLRRLSGRTAAFWTGCAVVVLESGLELVHVDLTSVVFRHLSDDEIARYVKQERPLDCAGGFKSEGLGIALFERIETQDPTALVGLPLIWLADALRRAGLPLP